MAGDKPENTVWRATEAQMEKSVTYTFPTEGKYVDKDIELTVLKANCLRKQTWTHACTANDANNGRLIFATVSIDDTTNYNTPWQVHYVLMVQNNVTKANSGYYDVKIGATGSQVIYYIQNNFNSSYYPIYYHNVYRPNSGYSSEGAMIGVRVQSASGPLEQRTYELYVLEEVNCKMNLRDSIGLYKDLYNSTKWTYAEYNATFQGLQETGDSDTITNDLLSNYRLTVDNEIPLCHGCLFGYTQDDKAVPFSAYNATYTSYTTSINTARAYPTHGIDWKKGIYATYSWTYKAKNTIATESIKTFISGLDFRYTDNCIASTGSANTLGLLDNKRVFVRGVIKSDGLFYITPTNVTYNNNTYKKIWTQDIPTTIETDSDGNQYHYWYIGMPYYNSSYPNSLYQINFEEYNPMYKFDGTNFIQVHPDLSVVATTGSYNDLINKPTIPSAVTESTVSGWGFTKNTGTYSKPSTGIPKTDLASAVQTSLGKADTALQEHQDISGKMDKSNPAGTGTFTMGASSSPNTSAHEAAIRSYRTSGNAGGNAINAGAVGTESMALTSDSAPGYRSVALNCSTLASGTRSFATGCTNASLGGYSSTFGQFNIAKGNHQMVLGRRNAEDTENKYALIVGNGSIETTPIYTSNAMAVDWDGNARFKGDIYVGCNSDSTGGTKVAGTVTAVKINDTTKEPVNGVVDLGTISGEGGSDGTGGLPAISLGDKNGESTAVSVSTTITKLNIGTTPTVNTDIKGEFFEVIGNGRIKCKQSGTVLINASVYAIHGSTAGYQSCFIYKNNSELISSSTHAAANVGMAVNCSSTCAVAAGDFFDIYGRANVSSSFYIHNAATTLDVMYLSTTGNININTSDLVDVPVGTVVSTGYFPLPDAPNNACTSTIEGQMYVRNPAELGYAGVWKFVDKHFKVTGTTDKTGWVTRNTTNAESLDLHMIRGAKSVSIGGLISVKTAATDSQFTIAQVNFPGLGIDSGTWNYRFIGACDSLNATALGILNSSGEIAIYDFVTRATSYPTTTPYNVGLSEIVVNTTSNHMIDSFCDKFFWERIS